MSDTNKCASCTTSCITPVIEVAHRRFGVERAIMTTVHAYTAGQQLVDGPSKNFRRGRAGGQSGSYIHGRGSRDFGDDAHLALSCVVEHLMGLPRDRLRGFADKALLISLCQQSRELAEWVGVDDDQTAPGLAERLAER